MKVLPWLVLYVEACVLHAATISTAPTTDATSTTEAVNTTSTTPAPTTQPTTTQPPTTEPPTTEPPTTDSPTTEPTTTCGETICMNGDFSELCQDSCDCTVANTTYFNGSRCETIILSNETVTTDISPRTCSFRWELPPNIVESEYQFVYMTTGVEEQSTKEQSEIQLHEVKMQDFAMIDNVTARIIELYSDGVSYTVCVIQNHEAEQLVDYQNSSRLDSSKYQDCIDIKTESTLLWEFTLAAFLIASLLIFIVITLIVVKLISDRIDTSDQDKYEELDQTSGQDKPEEEQNKKSAKQKKDNKKKAKKSSLTETDELGSENASIQHEHEVDQESRSKHSKPSDRSKGWENLGYEPEEFSKYEYHSKQRPNLNSKQANTWDSDDEPEADY